MSSVSQQLHKRFAQLFTLLSREVWQILLNGLCESTFGSCAHLSLACTESGSQLILRQ